MEGDTAMITVGRISTRRNARVHLSIDGRTGCGTAGRASIHHPATSYRSIDRGALCKAGCWKPSRLTLAQQEVTGGRRFNTALDDFLCDVRLIVGYEPQPVVIVPAPQAVVQIVAARPRRELSAWGQIAAGFAKTHTVNRTAAANAAV